MIPKDPRDNRAHVKLGWTGIILRKKVVAVYDGGHDCTRCTFSDGGSSAGPNCGRAPKCYSRPTKGHGKPVREPYLFIEVKK